MLTRMGVDEMTENEFILADRIAKIQSTIGKYGEDKFALSFSGGKDSCVLSALIDLALPGNKIPRVYANTGIELNMVRDFVMRKQWTDERIEIIKPAVPIKKMLEQEGYPFKSKTHSREVRLYQRDGYENHKGLRVYIGIEPDKKWSSQNTCPKKLQYQFTDENKLKISDMCCVRLKEEPLKKWQKEHDRPIAIIGIMREEGGRRSGAQCLAFMGNKLHAFQPLAVVSKDWEDWFIEEYKVEIPTLYYEPFNFIRTGCKGCPFSVNLQAELEVLERYFPKERQQCEIIWKPVYDEYRRLNYRLKSKKEKQSVGRRKSSAEQWGGI